MNEYIPENCDLGIVCRLIKDDGYVPETSYERVAEMVIAFYDDAIESDYYAVEDTRPYPACLMINPEDVMAFVNDSGGFKEFDYYC